ncbi:hypothetical protein JCM9533A_72380 [Catenuloplanes niger JCM 9533]
MGGQRRHAAMEETRRTIGVSYDMLWVRYFALTGDTAPIEVEAYLQGLMPLPALQEDILDQALRECARESDPQRPGDRDTPGESPA